MIPLLYIKVNPSKKLRLTNLHKNFHFYKIFDQKMRLSKN